MRAIATDVLEAAATWYADLRDAAPGDALHAAHARWLAAHPAHRQAWSRMEKLQQLLGSAPAQVARPVLSASGRSRRRAVRNLTGLLLVAGAGSWGWQRRDLVPARAAGRPTGVGARRDHRLADGGLLRLNTDSAADVRYGDTLREVLLHRGEVLVETARDAANRPFVVHTRHGSIRALGTRFSVRSDARACRVGVIEHAVEIRARNAVAAPLRLDAGRQATFDADGIGGATALEPNASAWIDGLLVASDWRLDAFAAELARYHPGHIGCDAAVAALRISGAFHVRDLDTVLANVGSTLPVRARHFTRYWIRLEAA